MSAYRRSNTIGAFEFIPNEGRTVWGGLIHQPHDDYGVWIERFHGIYSVCAVDWERIEFFLSLEAAKECVHFTWENVGPLRRAGSRGAGC